MTQTLRRVEIFQEGDHKAGPWDAASLVTMCKNSATLKDLLTPTFVIGHGFDAATAFGEEGEASFGKVTNICVEYRTPEGATAPLATLLADIEEVPDSLAALIHAGAYRTVSPEIYERLPNSLAGKVSGPVIKRVAVLGGSIPEVKTLQDVTDIYRKQAPALAFSDSHSQRPARRLRFIKQLVNDKTGTIVAFSEVQPMVTVNQFTRKPLAQCSDRTKAALVKFAEADIAGTSVVDGTPPPLTRDDFIAILADSGFDVTTITPETPDSVLAEMARQCRMKIEDQAANTAVTLSDDTTGMDSTTMGNSSTTADGSSSTTANMSDKTKVTVTKPAETITVTRAELRQMIADEVNAKAVTFSDTATKAAKKVHDDANFRGEVVTFCENLVKQGKMLPAHLDPKSPGGSLVEIIIAADAPTVAKFSDGKQTTAARRLMEHLGAILPTVVKFGDRIKNPTNMDSTTDDGEIVRFAEDNQETLKKSGRTKEWYIATFQAAKKQDPALTAGDWLKSMNAA